MSVFSQLQVLIQLPNAVLYSGEASKLYAESDSGAFGLWPNHADLVCSLTPSVLIITDLQQQERYFGLDQGLLVKHGNQVQIAVRRGLQGNNLAELATQVQQAFVQADEDERVARSALAKLELGMVKQLHELKRPLL